MTTPASAEPTGWMCPSCKSNAYAGGVYHWHGCEYDPTADIARALASQRAEIVARYEKVADELDRFSDEEQFEMERTGNALRIGARDAFDVAVSRIREAAPK